MADYVPAFFHCPVASRKATLHIAKSAKIRASLGECNPLTDPAAARCAENMWYVFALLDFIRQYTFRTTILHLPDRKEEMPASEDQEKKFQWNRQWYPVAVMRDLEARDPRQPYPVQVGED